MREVLVSRNHTISESFTSKYTVQGQGLITIYMNMYNDGLMVFIHMLGLVFTKSDHRKLCIHTSDVCTGIKVYTIPGKVLGSKLLGKSGIVWYFGPKRA